VLESIKETNHAFTATQLTATSTATQLTATSTATQLTATSTATQLMATSTATQTVEITAYEYFTKHYGIQLSYYVYLPCLDVGKPKRPNYLPLEPMNFLYFSKIIHNQLFLLNLSHSSKAFWLKNHDKSLVTLFWCFFISFSFFFFWVGCIN